MPLASTAYHRPLDPQFAALATRAVYDALAEPGRRALAGALATALGPAFSALEELAGAARLPAVLHRPTGMRFIAVVGGEMVMGLSPAELTELVGLYAPLGRAEEAREHLVWSTQPPHRVRIMPFLCASTPITARIAHILLADLLPEDEHGAEPKDEPICFRPICFRPRIAAELRGALGMRLLSEAEWEWIAREGGARSWLGDPPTAISMELDPARSKAPCENGFGMDMVHAGLEFVADAWHKGYEGAPADGVAWDPRAVPDHTRGCPGQWQDEMEAARLHAGVREGRHGDEDAAVRFVLDLP